MKEYKKLCYITLFILLSADRLAFVYKPTIRVSQVFYPIAFLYLAKGIKLCFSDVAWFFVLLLYCVTGEIWTYNFFKTSLYILWLIYNYLFVYLLFYVYSSKLLKENVLEKDELFLLPCRIYVIICIIILVLNTINHNLVRFFTAGFSSSRVCFLSYEPSYTALFLSPYCALVFYKYATEKVNAMHYVDFALLVGAFIAIKSSTLAMALAFSMTAILISKISFRRLLVFLVILFAALYIIYMNQYASFFLTRLFERGIVASGQGRYETMVNTTMKVFRENLFLGVGLAGYGSYIGIGWYVATNVTVEMLAELGIIGTSIFVIWLLPSIPREKKFLFIAAIFFMTYQGNQNYMRLYFWAYLGIWRAINNLNLAQKS